MRVLMESDVKQLPQAVPDAAGIDHVGPLLQHMAPLLHVSSLVADRARGTDVLVRQALLDPVAVEADFVQQRRAGAAQVVDGERFSGSPLVFAASTTICVTRFKVAFDMNRSAS